MSINELTAYLRLIVLIWVFWDCYKHRNLVGISIAFLYSASILIVTLGQYREYVAILSTPLVCLVAWHIFKSNREK